MCIRDRINTLNAQITEKENSIAALEEQILQKENEINALREKVEQRLVRSQQTMHTNQFLDFLMGAEDFASLLRRIQGVNDIMNYDKKSLEDLKTLMDQLNADKEQLNVEKEELEVAKTDVESKKRQVVSLKATAELAQKEYEPVSYTHLQEALAVGVDGSRFEIVQRGGNNRRPIRQLPEPVLHHDLNLADLTPVITFPTPPVGSGKRRRAQKHRFLTSQRARDFDQDNRMILGGDNLNLIALKQLDADQLRIGGNLPELVAQRLRIRQRHGLKVFVRRFDHAQKQRSADGVGESGKMCIRDR